ncbi:hypothetical protein ACW2QC_15025 [Virgibacillus sp. FSP13]
MTKIDRKMMMQLDNLRKLPAISLRLIPYLASKTDLDGRINITICEIENAGIMSNKVVRDALQHLEENKWIYHTENYHYYSNFNINSQESRKDYHYINLYKFFTDKKFFRLHQRQLLFLYYILSAKMPGTEHSIAIEHLYSNRTNQENVKMPFFISFEDMLTNLVKLIEAGFFEVRLGKSKLFFNKETENIKDKIRIYAGKTKGKKKQRMSMKEGNNKIIHIRISRNLVSKDQIVDIYDSSRLSTLSDLKSIAIEYGCSLDVYEEDMFKKIHATKEALYKEFGITGIQLYREAIVDFFETQTHSFENLMRIGEFSNVLKNYYVIPLIEAELNRIVSKVEKECTEGKNELPYGEFDSEHAIAILQKSNPYLSYFTDYAYNDRKILLDYDLKNINYNLYDEVSKLNRSWYLFRHKVDQIYKYEKNAYNNDTDQVVYLAKQGLLTDKNRQLQDISIKKQKVVYQKPENNILFYNWLEG